jgi:hypothetical protein
MKMSYTFRGHNIISVRKILTEAGWQSGVAVNIKFMLDHPKWMNAWLVLEGDADINWFIIVRVFWKISRK